MSHKKNVTFSEIKTQWHPAFCAAARLELIFNKDELDFREEYNLNRKPLQIDLLIIEKKQGADVEIQNEIGKIFRKYNIIEYKSPKDNLTIDDFFKTLGYAYIYKGLGESVNQVPLHELTISLVREKKPKKLLRELENCNCRYEEVADGIYYIYGLLIPAQIIVTKQLNSREHSCLRILSPEACEDEVREFLFRAKDLTDPGARADIDAVLQVSVSENMKLYDQVRRDLDMCEALKILMKDEIAAGKKEGLEEGLAKMREMRDSSAIEMLCDGKPDAEILKYLKMSEAELAALKKKIHN